MQLLSFCLSTPPKPNSGSPPPRKVPMRGLCADDDDDDDDDEVQPTAVYGYHPQL